MNKEVRKTDAASLYRGPAIVDVGDVVDLTGAGGEKIVDSYGPDGHTAIDWNKLNNPAPDQLDPDESE